MKANTLTLPEVAQRLRVPYRLAYDLVLSGELPANRTGRRFIVLLSDVEEYLRSHPQAASDDEESRAP
jgi:excisionase family DNA binding protein